MTKIEIAGRTRAAICLTTLALAGASLAACGGSSSTGSTSASVARSQPSTPAPTRSTTTSPASPAQTTTGKAQAGKATTPAKVPAPGAGQPHTRTPTTRPSPNSANSLRGAVTRFVECLRKNGVKIPKPSASGTGPVLPTAGLKTNTPQFRAAAAKCRATLVAGLRHSRPKVGAR